MMMLNIQFRRRVESARRRGVLLELRGNPNHDPKNGRFTSGTGLTSAAESGNIRSSNEVSATGENKFKRGFSRSNLDEHWDGAHSHKHQYPELTKEEYAKRALELVQKPVSGSVHGYKNASNQIVRYDSKTNDFVKGHPNKGIATMFKPTAGKKYFEAQKERESADE